MIRTDGRPTIAWAPHIHGQMTVDDVLAEIERENDDRAHAQELDEDAPIYGGHE